MYVYVKTLASVILTKVPAPYPPAPYVPLPSPVIARPLPPFVLVLDTLADLYNAESLFVVV